MKRVASIDCARGVAILFALVSHGLTQFTSNVHAISSVAVWIKLVTRSATPMFIILFGVTLNLVYLRKARSEQRAVELRLIGRAVLCYSLYVAITLAAVVSGKYGLLYFAKSLVFAETGRFGIILASYAILFCIIFATLGLGVRFGAKFYAALAAAAWAARGVLVLCRVPALPGVQQMLGHGKGLGPAVLLSFAFVAFGVFVGEAWEGRRSWRIPQGIALISFVGLALHAIRVGSTGYAYNLVFEYRWTNHPAYYAFGIVTTTASLLLTAGLVRSGRMVFFQGILGKVGSETLFAYTLGSVVLNLLPTFDGTGAAGVLLLFAFLGLMVVATIYKAPIAALTNWLSMDALHGFAASYARLSEMISMAFWTAKSRIRAAFKIAPAGAF